MCRTFLEASVQDELTGHQSRSHHHPRPQPGKQPTEACLPGQDTKSVGHGAPGAVSLVDLTEQSISRL